MATLRATVILLREGDKVPASPVKEGKALYAGATTPFPYREPSTIRRVGPYSGAQRSVDASRPSIPTRLS